MEGVPSENKAGRGGGPVTEKDGQLYCDKCHDEVDDAFSAKLGNIMNFDLCDRCERELELIVIDFLHGVKE